MIIYRFGIVFAVIGRGYPCTIDSGTMGEVEKIMRQRTYFVFRSRKTITVLAWINVSNGALTKSLRGYELTGLVPWAILRCSSQ